jgi:hypothetical protein
MKYKIGDKVWYARRKSEQKTIECPDCFGQRFLTVIKGDLSQVTIDCAGCASGYEPPKGYITYHESVVGVSEVTIDRKEETSKGVTYGFNGCYNAEETEMFDTKEGAEARALELSVKYNQEKLDEINRKAKHDRTWSWHVTYHRREIKRLREQLVYHSSKLDVAKARAKK